MPSATTKGELVKRTRALNDRQMQYVLWASVAPEMRRPPTAAEFAETVGVTRQMVARWGKDPRILDAIRMLVLANASDPGRISTALDFLYAAFQDESNSMKDRLAAVTKWLDTVGVTSTFRRENDLVQTQFQQEIDLSNMSDEELAKLYENVDKQIEIGPGEDGQVLTVADVRDPE